MFTIASWNVNSIKVRLAHVLQWLTTNTADVLCIQETKSQDQNFPEHDFREAGFHVSFYGQKTYNGVAIVSRSPIECPVQGLQGFEDEQARVLSADINGIHVIDVYVPNGQSLDSPKFQYKLNWLSALNAHLKDQLASKKDVVVLGDFNIAPEDRDVYDPAEWVGHVLCSPKEREAFENLLALGFHDSFRLFDQQDKSYSWWDYRQAMFRRGLGLRIDHILVSDGLSKNCVASIIDVEPRKWERPSDHTIVAARFDL